MGIVLQAVPRHVLPGRVNSYDWFPVPSPLSGGGTSCITTARSSATASSKRVSSARESRSPAGGRVRVVPSSSDAHCPSRAWRRGRERADARACDHRRRCAPAGRSALGQQQHDAEDAIKALDAQTHLVAHMQLVGGLDGVAVNAHVPGAYGGRGLGARLELAGCPQPRVHAHGGRGQGTWRDHNRLGGVSHRGA